MSDTCGDKPDPALVPTTPKDRATLPREIVCELEPDHDGAHRCGWLRWDRT